jgi:hypothetical protein
MPPMSETSEKTNNMANQGIRGQAEKPAMTLDEARAKIAGQTGGASTNWPILPASAKP